MDNASAAFCWADADVHLLACEGEDYRPDDWEDDSWYAIAHHCDRCETYDNCFKPEIDSSYLDRGTTSPTGSVYGCIPKYCLGISKLYLSLNGPLN